MKIVHFTVCKKVPKSGLLHIYINKDISSHCDKNVIQDVYVSQ